MNRWLFAVLGAWGLTNGAWAASTHTSAVGVVNFSECLANSKLGKEEQVSFETLKKQMTSSLGETEKEINELSTKFNDQDFRDGLSPEAEEELKNKFRDLQEKLAKTQNHYYQVLNQAHMHSMQKMSNAINTAAETIAKQKDLSMVMNKEACFFSASSLDMTDSVIKEMDKTFDEEAKKREAASTQIPETSPSDKK